MQIGAIITLFEAICFEKVLEFKVRDYGFDVITQDSTYNSCIKDCVEKVNTELFEGQPLVDIEIIDWYIGPHEGATLECCFYDRFYFDPKGEVKRKAALQKKK